MAHIARAFLSGIAYRLGASKPIEELVRISEITPEILQSLKDRGLRNYCEETASAAELCAANALETLRLSSLEPPDIDAIVFADSSADWSAAEETSLLTALNSANFGGKYIVGVGLQACGSGCAGLDVATALTGSHGFKNVLVILSGRVKKHHRRLGPLDATVFSDGVASCTISSEHGEFEVLASYSRTNTYLASIGSSTFRSAGIAFENLRDVCGRIYAASGLRPEDIRAVIGSNLNLASLHLMAEAAQVDPDQVHADDVARLGHVHACDNLIGLHNYREGRTLRPGDNFILFGWSPHVASASLLRFLA